MLDLVKKPDKDISLEARQRIAEQTVENFAQHINAGFLEHRKSATLGGEFAFTEWEGQGSLIRDALGREFIDMLGGFGLYSYGLRHPKIIEAVKAQLDITAFCVKFAAVESDDDIAWGMACVDAYARVAFFLGVMKVAI